METLEHKGVRVLPFAFPYNRDRALLEVEMHRLADKLGTGLAGGPRSMGTTQARPTQAARAGQLELAKIDYFENGAESHLWLVSSSDFNGEPARFNRELQEFLDATLKKNLSESAIPLGYVGVPPIFTDLFDVVEQLGGRVVFHEVARQFGPAF